MLLYPVVIFIGAFLLFQIQPLIAKMILPAFGGSSVVWSTCMVFFQVVLLIGYAYAHWLHHQVRPKFQPFVHSALLLASLAVLPIGPDAIHKVAASVDHPSWQILSLLAITIGLPYFLLSSTSPLLQAWYSSAPGGSPYRLYALSNLASLLALLTYPFAVEPNLTTRRQGWLWSCAYGAFVVLCAAGAWIRPRLRSATRPAQAGDTSFPGHRPNWRTRSLWILLAACGSMLLLAVTTFLTQDVAAVPFLWVLPLSAYLLTFILCFDSPRIYVRPVFYPLLAVSLALMAYMLNNPTGAFHLRWTVILSVLGLFCCCMVCHGELVRLKPPARRLTEFYVMVSAGGAAGGAFAAVAAPNIFSGYDEFPIGLALCALLATGILLFGVRRWLPGWKQQAAMCILLPLLGAYLWSLVRIVHAEDANNLVARRNFYGQLRVRDSPDEFEPFVHRRLLHGVINHGEQILDPQYRREPVSYFCHDTGIGRALLAGAPSTGRRIGILGLGCGTLAAYGRAGDTIRIYEINPLVVEIARREFSYLNDTAARVEVVMGDGRLSLEREPAENFDVLVMDAFSGDSVPVHLITLEAIQTYLRHLKPSGILAVNISNRHLDLRPVMAAAAAHYGKIARFYRFDADEFDPLCLSADWILMLDNSLRATVPALFRSSEELQPTPGFRPWTDDFSNLFGILK